MTDSGRQKTKKRTIGRRNDDHQVRSHADRYRRVSHVGKIIVSEMDMDALFQVIMDRTNEIMGTERSTVFLHDEEKNELWSLVATGMKKNEIRISSDHGLAGWVFQNNSPVIVNDVYSDPRFLAAVDQKTGFQTRGILCVPLVNREKQCIGSLQTLNKSSGDFTEDDKELLISISHYVAIALENAKLYKDVKNYSDELKKKLIRIETLERVKTQLTKFVPSSVAKLVEHDPDQLAFEKIPSDVTILFIDIQGFSKITESFDQKLVNDMVESHFSRYLECIYRHDGEVNETAGDGLMAIFKDDSVETHARKAVAAALDIVYENNALNKDLPYPWGRIDLHLGINSGEAYIGSTKMKSLTGERWTYTASGLVTVLAARIGALSSDTKLYVGPDTFRRVEDICECEFVGLKEIKNIKEPVPVHFVKSMRHHRTIQ